MAPIGRSSSGCGQQDRLPHLKRLADRGVAAPLETFHHASPVIWTSVATGVMPDVHGITEFVVPTIRGDQPVSSTLRRVPALWNMVTATGGRVAVLGWWASWPVEEVNGTMISDRSVHEIPDRVWPPEYLATFDAAARTAPRGGKNGSNRSPCSKRIVSSAEWRSISPEKTTI